MKTKREEVKAEEEGKSYEGKKKRMMAKNKSCESGTNSDRVASAESEIQEKEN